MRRWLFCVLALLLAVLAIDIAFQGRLGQAQEDDAEIIAVEDIDSCLGCHEDTPIVRTKMTAGAHGKVACQKCHVGVDRFPHPETAVAKKPQCATCHGTMAAVMARSAHRSGVKGAPTCATCHGTDAHTTPKISAAAPATQEASCKTCHAKVFATVGNSVHGTAMKAGATCTSCHGGDAHSVKALAPRNADATCATCHSAIAKGLAGGAHAKVGTSGATCATCHGANAHAISKSRGGAATCMRCHTDQVKQMAGHAHAGANCTTCHQEDIHFMKAPSGTSHAANCAACHTAEANAVAASAHTGKNAPTCAACHTGTAHTIKPAASMTAQGPDASCKTCHTDVADHMTNSVHGKAIMQSGKDMTCLTCHGKDAHHVTRGPQGAAVSASNSCKTCHADKAAPMGASKHDNPDKVPGDHPTCLSCHGKTIHAVTRPAPLTRKGQVELCSSCHDNAELMGRYGVALGAVKSYEQSFHGRAVLHYGKDDSATCTDCHGLHAVYAPDAPGSPVGPAHVAQTCGQCHPGGKMNFAMSGANHLRLKIDSTPVLRIEEQAFKWLIYGAMSFLFGMVLLDLRRKLFQPEPHAVRGRPITILIALGLLTLAGGIVLAYLRVPHAEWLWIISVVSAVAAFIIYRRRLKQLPPQVHGKMYQRFTLAQRIQHFNLALSFTLLVLTGFPLHFADVSWAQYILVPFGGLDGARIVHRVAGVLMVTNWIWHLFYLLYRWKKYNFSLKSWTMFPTWKDVRDLVDFVKWGLGTRKEQPQWDRFQFREKFDYFADMWGSIVMGSTGFVLWFPVLLGNHLPEWAFGFAYIAHSYEGLLAVMAIIIWHFYNTHFNPDMFPMNPVWWTGTLSEEEMEREHPLEKARIDAAQAVTTAEETR